MQEKTLKHLAKKDGRAKESDQKTAQRIFWNLRKLNIAGKTARQT